MEDRVIALTKQLNSTKADAQEERDSLNAQLAELRAVLDRAEAAGTADKKEG